jgi:hypothetical protein
LDCMTLEDESTAVLQNSWNRWSNDDTVSCPEWLNIGGQKEATDTHQDCNKVTELEMCLLGCNSHEVIKKWSALWCTTFWAWEGLMLVPLDQ